MSANLTSPRFQNVKIVTSMLIDEANNASTTADSSTSVQGLFVSPSEVLGRSDDVTGFLMAAANESGKLEFVDPSTAVTLSLGDLTDVTLGTPVADELLYFDGTEWVNGTPGTILTETSLGHSATATTASTFGLYGTTPIIQVDTSVTAAAFVAGAGAAVDDAATFGGYTIGQIVGALQAYGMLA